MIRTYSILAFLISCLSTPLIADDAIEWDGYLGATHDYRDRGLSLIRDDIAPEGLLRARFGENWQIKSIAARAEDGRGSDLRLASEVSYGFDRSGYRFSFAAEIDSFHGSDRSVWYQTVSAGIARDFGLLYTSAKVSFSPFGRWLTPNNASVYAEGALEVPVPKIPKLTLLGHWGYDFRDGLRDVFDWRAGFSLFLSDIEVLTEVQGSDVRQAFLGNRTDGFNFGATRLTVTARFYF